MFIDAAEITVKAGKGGPGKVSFYSPPMRGPDGGNGGDGGGVIAKVTSDLSALGQFAGHKIFNAEDGQSGGGNRRSGKNGCDLEVTFPIGSLLIDEDTKEEFELTGLSQTLLLCQGGKGGRGNFEFKSARRTSPNFAQPGTPGRVRRLKINLRLIADLGLIGLPNAGKSSLLNELTQAHAKVGSYPFTTLEPNLGVIDGKMIADIPGLIEGASQGKGLGVKFLKHIEKVGLMLHCISAESRDVFKDYSVVRNELEDYNSALADKPQLILLTKSDLVDKETLAQQVAQLKQTGTPVVAVSIHDWESLERLKQQLGTRSS